jgi:hypothetical protein
VRRFAQIACVLALAGVIASSASATESTIYPGVSIGKVKLDMTAAQVTSRLGKDFMVNDRATLGGADYVEYGWDFSSWVVVFRKSGGTYRAVKVSTTHRDQKTAARVGPGTHWLKLVRTYPGGRCSFGYDLGLRRHAGNFAEYLVAHKGGTQTIYSAKGVYGDKSNPDKATDSFVVEVHVRTPYVSLPEFAPNYPYRCAPGWDKTAAPKPLR